MNITENLNRIQQAKSDIRAAIIQKGGTVSEDAKIDEYADAVENIPSGDDDALDKIFDQTIEEIHSTTPVKSGRYLFYGQKQLRVADVVLSGAITADYQYQCMFMGCTGLTKVPDLPDTKTTSNCYSYMFQDCTSLTTAPKLPATTLGAYCYQYMFSGCTSLTTAPELPATTLGSYCYQDMFEYCTSLVQTPELPVTTLKNYCYHGMFVGCTSLTTAPELLAITLTSYCYAYMFSGCTSLVQVPDLPATSLASSCYNSMFKNCTSLQKTGKIYATGNISSSAANMFSGCTSLREMTWMATTPPTIASSIWTNCPSDMIIYVPDEAVDAYKAANIWKTRAAYIKPMSEKPTE